MHNDMRAIAVMGVTGCGKSTVAKAVSERLGAVMVEGDAFHPERNVRKMSAGIPLDDDDRQGWLEQLGHELTRALETSELAALTCSALKRRYRDVLRAAVPALGFAFLKLSPDAATARVEQRHGHFMPATLVDSQFRDLEPPTGESLVLTVDGTASVAAIVDRIEAWWRA